MAKQAQNSNGNLTGPKKLTVRDAHCYIFTGRWLARMTKKVLKEGTKVRTARRGTRKARSRYEIMLLVRTDLIDPAEGGELWVRLVDLKDIQ
jgi:hypothetical protein